MKQLFIIYDLEKGGIGYKPAKINLPEGTRICLDREKMKFAKVIKVVELTSELMHKAWRAAESQNRYFQTDAIFRMHFLSFVEGFVCLAK